MASISHDQPPIIFEADLILLGVQREDERESRVPSSSGRHCSLEQRSRRLDFPTDEFPMSSSLTFMDCAADVCAIIASF